MLNIKKLIKMIVPRFLLSYIQNYFLRRVNKKYENLSTKEIFTKIYNDKAWGESNEKKQRFYSGSGSHDENIVNTYLIALQKSLSTFEKKPNVVDLGCGDFYVGSKVRPLCEKYIACDIVESVIDFNLEKYKDLNVDFRVLDLTKDELPAGDIVFIRQVLQHLSNEQITEALPQLIAKYKYLVLTEHLPALDSFPHNLDKPSGPDVRLGINSGVVLTSAPFNLPVTEDFVLCEVTDGIVGGGIIRTNMYKLII